MQDAVRDLVRDGDTVAIEGFTHLICFAAGHEIIRQRRRDLTLARMTPDVIYDQMIGAGVARKLIFSWMGNPGVGNLHAVRRRIENADPAPLEIEEYSHFGMVSRYMAGAANLPFFPIRSYYESDIPKVNPKIVPMTSPYDADDEVYVVPPLRPDVAIVHAQRADADGDTQIWGLLGCQKEAAFAAERVIVVVEEVVRRGGDPPRPEPDRDPRRGRRRGRGGAVRVPSVVRAGLLRPRQRASTWSGTGSRRTPRRSRPGSTSGSTAWRTTASTWRSWATRTGTRCGPSRRSRARSTTGGTRERRRATDLGYSKNEIMIAASARLLGGAHNCFVGVGLPNIVCNLAQRTVAPELQLDLRVRRLRRAPRAAAAVDRRPDARDRRDRDHEHVRAVRVLPAARAGRRGVPRRRADRPVREPQHDGDRRLRAPEGPAARARAAPARSRSTRSRSW